MFIRRSWNSPGTTKWYEQVINFHLRLALQSIVGDPFYCYMYNWIFWWIILYSTADVTSSLLMFDAEGLVPCLLQQVLPLIVNHADAEAILGDPKVCTKKYYCYSYFKSPFTDKKNLTSKRICDQNKGVTHHLREKTLLPVRLFLDAATTKGHYPFSLTVLVETFPVHNDQLYPFGPKKIRPRENWLDLTASIITVIRHDNDMTLVLPHQSLSFYLRTLIRILRI